MSNSKCFRHTPAASRRVARPSFAAISPSLQQRTQGRPGARRPHGPRANEMHGAGTTGSAETSRPSLRDGFNAYTCSPWGPALLPPCHDNARRALRSASAPGCQDHTISRPRPAVRPRAFVAPDLKRKTASHFSGSCALAAACPRPSHSVANVRDDRDTSLSGTERAEDRTDLGEAPSDLCFSEGLDERWRTVR